MKASGCGKFILILIFLLALLNPQFIKSQSDVSVYSSSPPAAQNFHQWGAVTLFNGLPSDNVRAIAQTADGVLWFGTDNGLAKFDGRRVAPVPVGDANKILALKTLSNENLWIGTDAGAFVFDGKNFQLIEATRGISITAILEAAGKIWLATDQGFIFAATKDEKQNSFSVTRIPAENLSASNGFPLKITSLAQLGDRIIAGTRSRSFIVLDGEQTFELFSRPRPFFVNALARDEQTGQVWLGADSEATASGLFSIRDAARPTRVGSSLGNVTAIAPDGNSGAWVGTEANGLFHFTDERETAHYTFENTAGGLRSNSINALLIDRENVVWIGTSRGVCRFDASSPSNSIISDKGNSNFVRALFRESNGQILAGTNRGLFLLSEGVWLESQDFAGKAIYAVAENSNGKTMIATPNGLFGETDAAKPTLAGDVRGAANFKGTDYAGIFGRGIVQVENQELILANDAPTALFAGKEKLFIGTAAGEVFIFDGKTIEKLSSFDALNGSAIWKIFESGGGGGGGGGGDLWLAGGRGLFLYRNGNLQNVIADQDVRDVVVIDKNIWAATVKNGVYHMHEDEIFGWLVFNLNVEQGLPSEQTFALLPTEEEDSLIIGTNRGAAIYKPSRVAPRIIPTRVLSQRLHDVNELQNTIALDYPQNSLLVEVAGLSSRTFPEQFQYAFLLKNSRGETIDKRLSNDAQYAPTNLKAGEYQIEARAFNKDLLASAPLVIKFSVARAPFPRTAVALGVLLAIAVAGLIWAIIEHQRIRNKNHELAAARFDLANEAERERRRIARDLHDQTLADLRELMLKSDKLNAADASGFRREIESVSIEIRRICEDLSPSVLENVGLSPALEFLLSHSSAADDYKFSAAESIDETAKFSSNAQMQIYRIAQEVLTNIKHHSGASRVEIKIEISPENEYVLRIKNDGKFFNPGEIDKTNLKGRGISNIKARAALIKANIGWEISDAAAGETVFELRKKI